MSPWLIGLATLAAAIFIYHLVKFATRPSLPLPPGPKPWPIIGNLPHLAPVPHHSIAALAHTHGPLMHLKLGFVDVVVAASASVAKQFLKVHDANFSSRPLAGGTKYMDNLQDLVFAPYGPRWRALRKITTVHLFSGKAMDESKHLRQEEVARLTRNLASSHSKAVNLGQLVNVCTTNALTRAMMGRRVFDDGSGSCDPRADEFKAMVVELMVLGGVFNISDFIPQLAWLDLQGVQAKVKKVEKKFHAFLTNIIEEHKSSISKGGEHKDLLTALLSHVGVPDENGHKLTEHEIKGLLQDMFVAGTDTSSSTTEWAIAELIRNPRILAQVQQELDTVVGRERNVKEEDLPHLPYLQAVVKENFRLHPSTPLSLPRIAAESCEIFGYHIPKGATIMVNVWAIARDPKEWTNPLEFKPERFLPGGEKADVDVRGTDFEVIPFGAGRRIRRKKQQRSSVTVASPKPLPPKPPIAYLLLTDGSCVPTLQVMVDSSVATPSRLLPTGTCILVEGQLERPSAAGKHVIQLKADRVLHIGTVDFDKYPLTKKRVPLDALRDYSQFRPRTTTVATVMRIRSALSFATHSFFKDHAFFDVQVPTITATGCEGFSNKFQVTALDHKADKEKLSIIDETAGINLELMKAAAKEKSNQIETLKRTESNREALAAAIQDLRKTNELASQLEVREKKKFGTSSKDDKADSSKDFFPSQTYLTVSGRLHLESYACALGNVYSFGPRFQADKTDSATHAAEMWMVEVEMAFAQLTDSMNCANDLFKHFCEWVLNNCSEDMKFVAKRIDNICMDRLRQIISGSPEMISYNEATGVLRKVSSQAEDRKFETNFEPGVILTSDHLSYLADAIYQKPVMIHSYPKEAKPFYTRINDDGTVAAFDLVVPKVGTIISGSQNEERLDMISSRIDELGLPQEKYEWYLDLRRNGTVKHSGFTLRFDLMVLFITGLSNVRDVIPFPRSYGKVNN